MDAHTVTQFKNINYNKYTIDQINIIINYFKNGPYTYKPENLLIVNFLSDILYDTLYDKLTRYLKTILTTTLSTDILKKLDTDIPINLFIILDKYIKKIYLQRLDSTGFSFLDYDFKQLKKLIIYLKSLNSNSGNEIIQIIKSLYPRYFQDFLKTY